MSTTNAYFSIMFNLFYVLSWPGDRYALNRRYSHVTQFNEGIDFDITERERERERERYGGAFKI